MFRTSDAELNDMTTALAWDKNTDPLYGKRHVARNWMKERNLLVEEEVFLASHNAGMRENQIREQTYNMERVVHYRFVEAFPDQRLWR